jgi:hypothetical protein
MSSRVAIQQFTSVTEPVGVQLGDEWYNPSTGSLKKRVALSSGVGWIDLVSGSGSSTSGTSSTSGSRGATIVTTVLTSKALSNTAISLPSSQTYTTSDTRQYLDVYVDGYKLVRGVDYAESGVSTITPLISIPVGSTIEYRIS